MPYDEKNRGAIWKNDRKETDNHPDFTGKINVEGVEYWVSAWKRRPDEDPGRPALNFSIRPKNPPQAPAARPAAPQDFDDQIPF